MDRTKKSVDAHQTNVENPQISSETILTLLEQGNIEEGNDKIEKRHIHNPPSISLLLKSYLI